MCFEVFWRHFLMNWIYNGPYVANIYHLILNTDLYTKSLHSFIINDKITSSGKSSTGGSVKI